MAIVNGLEIKIVSICGLGFYFDVNMVNLSKKIGASQRISWNDNCESSELEIKIRFLYVD